VRLNFVFFTDSVSELYGQRMYMEILEETNYLVALAVDETKEVIGRI
jgi:hypothetical protein